MTEIHQKLLLVLAQKTELTSWVQSRFIQNLVRLKPNPNQDIGLVPNPECPFLPMCLSTDSKKATKTRFGFKLRKERKSWKLTLCSNSGSEFRLQVFLLSRRVLLLLLLRVSACKFALPCCKILLLLRVSSSFICFASRPVARFYSTSSRSVCKFSLLRVASCCCSFFAFLLASLFCFASRPVARFYSFSASLLSREGRP